MLVREPSHRLRLEDIEQDPWLASDGTSEEVLRTNLPLLSREQVSEEDHSYVVQKMVEGKICTREEIFHSLERDAYDHVAATYYLLVERRLRKRQQQEAAAAQTMNIRKLSAPSTHQSHLNTGGKPHLEPLMLSPRKPKEVKKTKTAPLYKPGAAPPALVITPPVIGESSCLMKLPVSPGGPEYVKSLTTSMTLDRRNHNGSRKKREDQPTGEPRPCPLQNIAVTLLPPKGQLRKDKQRVKSAPLSSGEKGLASTVNKKSSGPSFSKIAILSSFFERRAAQEAGTVAPLRPHQRLLPWIATRDRNEEVHMSQGCSSNDKNSTSQRPPATNSLLQDHLGLSSAKKESVLVQSLSGILENYKESSVHSMANSELSISVESSQRLDSSSSLLYSQRTSSLSLAKKTRNNSKPTTNSHSSSSQHKK